MAIGDLGPRPLPARMVDMGRDNGIGAVAERMARHARQPAQPALIFLGALPCGAPGAGRLARLKRRGRQAKGAHQNATRKCVIAVASTFSSQSQLRARRGI